MVGWLGLSDGWLAGLVGRASLMVGLLGLSSIVKQIGQCLHERETGLLPLFVQGNPKSQETGTPVGFLPPGRIPSIGCRDNTLALLVSQRLNGFK